MECPECGSELREGGLFCPHCGASVAELTSDERPTSPAEAVSEEATTQAGASGSDARRARFPLVAIVAGLLVAGLLVLLAVGASGGCTSKQTKTVRLTLAFVAKGLDGEGSRIPIRITGTTTAGEEIDQQSFAAVDETQMSLAPGSYTVQVLGSPISSEGVLYAYEDATDSVELAAEDGAAEDDAKQLELTLEPRAADEVTDDQIADAVSWVKRDDEYADRAERLEKAAKQRRDTEKQRKEEERAEKERAEAEARRDELEKEHAQLRSDAQASGLQVFEGVVHIMGGEEVCRIAPYPTELSRHSSSLANKARASQYVILQLDSPVTVGVNLQYGDEGYYSEYSYLGIVRGDEGDGAARVSDWVSSDGKRVCVSSGPLHASQGEDVFSPWMSDPQMLYVEDDGTAAAGDVVTKVVSLDGDTSPDTAATASPEKEIISALDGWWAHIGGQGSRTASGYRAVLHIEDGTVQYYDGNGALQSTIAISADKVERMEGGAGGIGGPGWYFHDLGLFRTDEYPDQLMRVDADGSHYSATSSYVRIDGEPAW